MKYIYLTGEFLGSAAALQKLVKTIPECELAGVFISERRRGLGHLWHIMRHAGSRYAVYILAVSRGYRLIQKGASIFSRLFGGRVLV